MTFSPEKARYRAFQPEMLRFHLNTKYETEAPMGNMGLAHIDTVIKAWLVGLREEISPILPRALEWIDEGIAKHEQFLGSVDGHRANLWAGRAIGAWLLDGSSCEDMWHQALLAERTAWVTDNGGWTDNEVRQLGLDEAMAYALLSGVTQGCRDSH